MDGAGAALPGPREYTAATGGLPDVLWPIGRAVFKGWQTNCPRCPYSLDIRQFVGHHFSPVFKLTVRIRTPIDPELGRPVVECGFYQPRGGAGGGHATGGVTDEGVGHMGAEALEDLFISL